MEISKKQTALIRKAASFFPPPPILRLAAPGFDISDEEVRYVNLVDTGRGKEVGAFGIETLDKGVVQRGEIKKKEKLVDVISKIARENQFRFVRSSLPDERAYLFQIDVSPDMKPEEIKTMLEFKLEEYVPVSSEEAIFDYMPMGIKNEDGKMKLSVSVFSRKTVNKYVEVFEEAGLTPFSLETDTQAISRAVIPVEEEGGSCMIVNFGNLRTNLAIVYNGVVSFTSTLEIGGETINEAIREHYAVTQEKARQIKYEYGFTGSKHEKGLFFSMMSTASALKDEMNKHLSYWKSRMGSEGAYGELDKIILCGANAGIRGLKSYIQESMEVPTEEGDVWANAFSAEEVVPPIPRRESPLYSTAVGLALRREGKK